VAAHEVPLAAAVPARGPVEEVAAPGPAEEGETRAARGDGDETEGAGAELDGFFSMESEAADGGHKAEEG